METLPNPKQPAVVQRCYPLSYEDRRDFLPVVSVTVIGSVVGFFAGTLPNAIFGTVPSGHPGPWEWGGAAVIGGGFLLFILLATLVYEIGNRVWPPLEFCSADVRDSYVTLQELDPADREEAMPAYNAVVNYDGTDGHALILFKETVRALRHRREIEKRRATSPFIEDAEAALQRIREMNRELES